MGSNTRDDGKFTCRTGTDVLAKAEVVVLTHVVGRTAYPGSSGGDETVCLDVKKRECQEPKAYEFLQKKALGRIPTGSTRTVERRTLRSRP